MTPVQEATILHLLHVGTNGVPYQGFTPAIPSLCIPTITEQDGSADWSTYVEQLRASATVRKNLRVFE